MTKLIRTTRHTDVSQPARRSFLKTLLASSATLSATSSWASVQRTQERAVSFRNLHTGESLSATYWAEGEYLAGELTAINQVLRDHRSGDVHAMDKKLMDLLFLLQQSVGVKGPYHVISGYRSPASNAKLHAKSNGVAKRSLHMQGKAIDIRLPGCDLKHLRSAALELKAGGVGYYAKSDFIHVDTGRVRRW